MKKNKGMNEKKRKEKGTEKQITRKKNKERKKKGRERIKRKKRKERKKKKKKMIKRKEKNPKKIDLRLSHCSHSLTCLLFQLSIRFFLPLLDVARLFLATKKFPLLQQMHYATQQIPKHGSRSQSQFCIIVPALLLLLLLLMLLCASIAKSCACFPLVHHQL
jgi:hypothetical protein